jgi:hypothetical protein
MHRSTSRKGRIMRSPRVVFVGAAMACVAGVPGMVGGPALKHGQVARGEQAAQGEATLPITRITLYRSGVGCIERRGQVQGDASVSLQFRTEQINDILKSLVVLDLSGGQVGGVAYASQEPLSRRLGGFGIGIGDSPSSGDLLQRLRGAPVTIRTREGNAKGIVLNVESRPTIYQAGGQAAAVRHDLPWINLLTDGGVRSYNLTEASGFQIDDPALAEELRKALGAIAQERSDRTKRVEVSFRGQGTREVFAGYVQEAPVWKASYRLVLPEGERGEATLQAWAIVENTTDEDWRDVQLALVSGQPSAFRMNLYEPLFAPRPEVGVPVPMAVLSKAYKDAPGLELAKAIDQRVKTSDQAFRARSEAITAPPHAISGGAMVIPGGSSSVDLLRFGVSAAAVGAEVGEVFSYQVSRPVSIERQRSAMLPIVSGSVQAKRVSIVSPGDAHDRPMRGLRLTNDTGLQLIAGPIAVYERGTYAGDAQVADLGKGESRLMSYALDADVRVQREEAAEEVVRRVRIVKGSFDVSVVMERATTYKFRNGDAESGRTMIVEHPRYPGFALLEPAKASEETGTLYRFETDVAPGASSILRVRSQMVTSRSVGISSMPMESLLSYQSTGQVSDAVVQALREAQRLQGVIDEARVSVETLVRERDEVTADQKRIRENLQAVDRSSELAARLTRKLGDQEARFEALAQSIDQGRAALAQAERVKAEYVAGLDVE